MATRTGIDSQAQTKLSDELQRLVFAVELEFDTETIRLHTGGGELTIDSNTYEGVGTLLAMSDVEDNQELSSSGVTFSLSGMDTEVLGYALTENYQNRKVTMRMAFLSGGTDHVVGEFIIYSGRMTNIGITDDAIAGSTITVQTESRLMDLKRPSNYRYTQESQNYLHSGDTSLDEVSAIQDMQLMWGREGNGGTGAGGGNRGEPPYEIIPNLP